MEWISVNEKLPPMSEWSGDTVLAFTEEGYVVLALYDGERPGEWYDSCNDSGYITHWMPRPPAPEV